MLCCCYNIFMMQAEELDQQQLLCSSSFSRVLVMATKVILLLTVLIGLQYSSTVVVEAVDIAVFNSASSCSGNGFTFAGISSQVCAAFNGGSVLIRDLSSSQTGRVFNGGGCTTKVGQGTGPDVRCFVGGGFTGALWFNGRVSESSSSSRCTSSITPNGILFTKDITKGAWVLKASNPNDLMAQLQTLHDDAHKVAWLQQQGAYFEAGSAVGSNLNIGSADC